MTSKTQGKRSDKAIALGASALIAATMAPIGLFAQTAYAATETRTITWHNGQPQPVIPPTITGANGQILTLQSQTRPVQATGSNMLSQDFTQTASGIAYDVASVSAAVPATFHVNSDGYNGNIPRVKVDYTPVNRTVTDHYEETRTVQGATEAAAKANLKNAITSQGRTLTLSGSTAEVVQTDSNGTPTRWSATGTYTADVARQVFDHYNVVGTYRGRLTKSVNNGDWSMSMVYSGPDDPQNPEQQPPADQQKTSYVVHYYKEGTTEELSPAQQIVDQPVNTEVTVAAIEIPGYEVVGDREQKITLGAENNEINFFYKQVENTDIAPVVPPMPENTNEPANEPEPEPEPEPQKNEEIPILPIAIGAAVAAAAVVGGIVLVRRKKKKNAVDEDGIEDVAVLETAEFDDADDDFDYSVDVVEEGIDATPVATAVVGGALFDDYAPESQLIEVVPRETEDAAGNVTVEYDQIPKADIEIIPSIAEDIPTVLYLPSTTDDEGNRITTFVSADNAQYWIAIDEETADRAVSKEIIVASNESDEIFRGSLIDEFGELTQQLMLDGDLLVSALNGKLEEGQTQNIFEELEKYETKTNKIIDEQRAAAQQAVQPAEESFDFDDEFEDSDSDDEFADFTDEEFDEFETKIVEKTTQDDEDEFDDYFADDDEGADLEDLLNSDNSDDEDFDIFSDKEEEEIDDRTDFEKEMDDFDAFADFAEPDVDGGYEGEYDEQFEVTEESEEAPAETEESDDSDDALTEFDALASETAEQDVLEELDEFDFADAEVSESDDEPSDDTNDDSVEVAEVVEEDSIEDEQPSDEPDFSDFEDADVTDAESETESDSGEPEEDAPVENADEKVEEASETVEETEEDFTDADVEPANESDDSKDGEDKKPEDKSADEIDDDEFDDLLKEL